MEEAGFGLSVSDGECSVMFTGWPALNLGDEPATKVRHRRDFDSQAVATKSKALRGFPPDFLSRPVALMDFMRLSLKRAAHVAFARSAK